MAPTRSISVFFLWVTLCVLKVNALRAAQILPFRRRKQILTSSSLSEFHVRRPVCARCSFFASPVTTSLLFQLFVSVTFPYFHAVTRFSPRDRHSGYAGSLRPVVFSHVLCGNYSRTCVHRRYTAACLSNSLAFSGYHAR